jgi:hypothetical protein
VHRSSRSKTPPTAVTDKTYHGAEAVREWIADFLYAFDADAHHEIEEIIADGEPFVVSMVCFAGRGLARGHHSCSAG